MHNAAKFLLVFVLLNLCDNDLRAETGSFNPDATFVYRDMVGGPYFDEWYLDGDLVSGADLRLLREGKSGSLEIPVAVSCELPALTVTGAAVVFGHLAISAAQAQDYLTAEISAAVIDSLCLSN